MTVTTRVKGGHLYQGRYRSGYNGVDDTNQLIQWYTGYTVEKLTSTNHIFPGKRKKLSAWEKRYIQYYGTRDYGGPFSVQRRETVVVPGLVRKADTSPLSHASLYWMYDGHVVPFETPQGRPGPTAIPSLINNSQLVGKGVVGWNRFKPTHTQINLGQTLGELRAIGGLPISPKMIQDLRGLGNVLRNPLNALKEASKTGIPAHDALRLGGSGYLGYQFGIKPYVSDIMDLVKSITNFDKNLRQLVRDNGKAVRRKGRVSFDEAATVASTSSTNQGGMVLPSQLAGQLSTGIYNQDKTISNSLEFWFSGRFRYHLDPLRHGVGPIPDRERFQLQRILYGLDPTDVSLIWELMPWSWLIDWIVPIGPMIDNLVNDQADHLVADYAYIMGRSVTKTHTVVRGRLANSPPFITSLQIIDTTKQRAVASPYGFGYSFSGFNPKQLAILAALGVSR